MTEHGSPPMATDSLVAELERLAGALETDSATSVEVSMPAIAERIARDVGVRAEEVAILGVSQRWRHLHFLVPLATPHWPRALCGRVVRRSTIISWRCGMPQYLKE